MFACFVTGALFILVDWRRACPNCCSDSGIHKLDLTKYNIPDQTKDGDSSSDLFVDPWFDSYSVKGEEEKLLDPYGNPVYIPVNDGPLGGDIPPKYPNQYDPTLDPLDPGSLTNQNPIEGSNEGEMNSALDDEGFIWWRITVIFTELHNVYESSWRHIHYVIVNKSVQ